MSVSGVAVSREEPSGRRRDVLRVLKAGPGPMSIAAIAKVLEVHPNTVRFHLNALSDDGQVELIEPDRRRPGRPPLMFRATPQMDRSGPRNFQVLAEILVMSLAGNRNVRGKAQSAGRAWGRELRTSPAQGKKAGAKKSIDHLVGVLDDLGFAPERRESGGEQQIGLRHCPFLELAEVRAKVVCPIHLGLMQGVLENQQVTVDRLDAFVEPDLCVAHLTLQSSDTAII
ncbi:helix-turn-helix transcriptional regulator [Mycobacterium asiaticum]|uniref:Transcriptional regulator n=1 Tax=Mycobacterium asiaticum TaxID=1790 RepID=A0A1A3MRM9_MYCAS|nr:helix-turn-helix domain-containing protein [Mycobacterium asiaticum]OBK11720.1 transcriptional regulator [Mycobacterium asiaticum]